MFYFNDTRKLSTNYVETLLGYRCYDCRLISDIYEMRWQLLDVEQYKKQKLGKEFDRIAVFTENRRLDATRCPLKDTVFLNI